MFQHNMCGRLDMNIKVIHISLLYLSDDLLSNFIFDFFIQTFYILIYIDRESLKFGSPTQKY